MPHYWPTGVTLRTLEQLCYEFENAFHLQACAKVYKVTVADFLLKVAKFPSSDVPTVAAWVDQNGCDCSASSATRHYCCKRKPPPPYSGAPTAKASRGIGQSSVHWSHVRSNMRLH